MDNAPALRPPHRARTGGRHVLHDVGFKNDIVHHNILFPLNRLLSTWNLRDVQYVVKYSVDDDEEVED